MTENTVAKVQEKFGGTWEQIESGRMLQSTATSSNQKGGSSTATFTSSGTVGDTSLEIDQIPSHTHTRGTMNITGTINMVYFLQSGYGYRHIGAAGGGAFTTGGTTSALYSFTASPYSNTNNAHTIEFDASRSWTGETSSVGGNQSHTHTFTGNQTTIDTVSPYITVYMYKRTA